MGEHDVDSKLDTCRKHSISFFGYLKDIFSAEYAIPRLSLLISQKASNQWIPISLTPLCIHQESFLELYSFACVCCTKIQYSPRSAKPPPYLFRKHCYRRVVWDFRFEKFWGILTPHTSISFETSKRFLYWDKDKSNAAWTCYERGLRKGVRKDKI